MLLLLVRGTVVLCGTGRAIQYCTVTVTARSHHDHAGSRRSRKMEKKRSIGGQIANRVATDEDALLETDRRAHLIVQGAPPLAMRPPACLPACLPMSMSMSSMDSHGCLVSSSNDYYGTPRNTA